jgi:probable rRNA maturation factor
VSDGESPTGTTAGVVVVCTNEQDEIEIDPERWRALATCLLSVEGQWGELTLTFVGREEMAELNLEHMGASGPTDVLSFPLDSLVEMANRDEPRLLGDVVVCPAVAAAQAPQHAGTLDDELALLIVHGILHILGWDHATDDETVGMQAKERALLDACHQSGNR